MTQVDRTVSECTPLLVAGRGTHTCSWVGGGILGSKQMLESGQMPFTVKENHYNDTSFAVPTWFCAECNSNGNVYWEVVCITVHCWAKAQSYYEPTCVPFWATVSSNVASIPLRQHPSLVGILAPLIFNNPVCTRINKWSFMYVP